MDTVLHLANAYSRSDDPPEIFWFAEAVAEASSGSVRINVVSSWTSKKDRHEESSLIRDVQRGKVDLGWAGARVFGALGVRSLDSLQMPFLITDYASQVAVCMSDAPREMLEPLERIGLVGLVILPGALRKPFGFSRPLVNADDYAGRVIRTHESIVGERTFRLLGATPVLLSAFELATSGLGLVDGMELHAEAIAGWGYSGSVTWNANIWPRILTIVANKRVFERLGSDERALLREAAGRVSTRATAALADQEDRDRATCPPTVQIAIASASDLAELRDRVEPIYRELQSHAESRDHLRRLQQVITSSQGLSKRGV